MNLTIAHLTSVHSRYDTRIFIKMCSSLANQGYIVTLVVADGLGNERRNDIQIIDVGATTGGRLSRMTMTVKSVFKKAKALNADIYHLHDPELMPIGLKLKRLGKKVIFDAHEDLPKQILSKLYLNSSLTKLLSILITVYESWVCSKFDAIITATPCIRNKFLRINANSIDVNNFPMIGELVNYISWNDKEDEVCYVGSITAIRGIKEVTKAMEQVKTAVRLNLAGEFSEQSVFSEVKTYEGWKKVNVLGFLGRSEVASLLARSVAGLVTLHPVINYIDALPVKMFEYMSASIPIIASDFGQWKEIVEGRKCGLCIDPLDSKAIAEAIDYIINHPSEAKRMGQNGRKAVMEKYNWTIEEVKLLTLYQSLGVIEARLV